MGLLTIVVKLIAHVELVRGLTKVQKIQPWNYYYLQFAQ